MGLLQTLARNSVTNSGSLYQLDGEHEHVRDAEIRVIVLSSGLLRVGKKKMTREAVSDDPKIGTYREFIEVFEKRLSERRKK